MFNEKQRIIRLHKFSKILEVLPKCGSIGQISEMTGIPTSTIQRYLNDERLYLELFEEDKNMDKESIKKLFDSIKETLKQYKKNGLSNGGKKSQEMFGYSQNEIGQFKGRGQI